MKRIISLILLFAVLISAFSLSSCSTGPAIDFEYTLTEDDYLLAKEELNTLREHIKAGKGAFRLMLDMMRTNDSLNYISHQYQVAEMGFYLDITDEDAYARYELAESYYNDLRGIYIEAMKELYNSESSIKDAVFEQFTEAQLAILLATDAEVVSLQERNAEIRREFTALENAGSEEWSDEYERLYFEFVANGQKMAKKLGYDNYYEYASSDLYMREYTKEERTKYREYLKKYVLPLAVDVKSEYKKALSLLSSEERKALASLSTDSCTSENEYLSGYINSFGGTLKSKMLSLFSKEAVIYTESENARDVAFTGYSYYYMEPYVFFGKDCQDLLTVTHELGHYAAYYYFDSTTLPFDIAEVHSQGNEWLMLYYLEGEMSEAVYNTFLLSRLFTGLKVILYSAIVDEYEEEIYSSEAPYASAEYESVMQRIADSYSGLDLLGISYDPYTYAQYVTIPSAVYYLSYSTSEIAAMEFYMLAKEEGYDKAQEVYSELCEDIPTDMKFAEALEYVGLYSPFEEETFELLSKIFLECTD